MPQVKTMISSITYVWYVLYASKEEETCAQPDNNHKNDNNDNNNNNKQKTSIRIKIQLTSPTKKTARWRIKL